MNSRDDELKCRFKQAVPIAEAILELHEATLKAAEGGPEAAEEWVKLLAEYMTVCTAGAAVVADALSGARQMLEDLNHEVNGESEMNRRNDELEKALKALLRHIVGNSIGKIAYWTADGPIGMAMATLGIDHNFYSQEAASLLMSSEGVEK